MTSQYDVPPMSRMEQGDPIQYDDPPTTPPRRFVSSRFLRRNHILGRPPFPRTIQMGEPKVERRSKSRVEGTRSGVQERPSPTCSRLLLQVRHCRHRSLRRRIHFVLGWKSFESLRSCLAGMLEDEYHLHGERNCESQLFRNHRYYFWTTGCWSYRRLDRSALGDDSNVVVMFFATIFSLRCGGKPWRDRSQCTSPACSFTGLESVGNLP